MADDFLTDGEVVTLYIGHSVRSHVPELTLREVVMELLVAGISPLDVLGGAILFESYSIEVVDLVHALRMELQETIKGCKTVCDAPG